MLNHWSNKHFEFDESALKGVFSANHCRLYQMFEVIELVLDICLVDLVPHHNWSLICYRSFSIYSIHIRFYLFEYNTCFLKRISTNTWRLVQSKRIEVGLSWAINYYELMKQNINVWYHVQFESLRAISDWNCGFFIGDNKKYFTIFHLQITKRDLDDNIRRLFLELLCRSACFAMTLQKCFTKMKSHCKFNCFSRAFLYGYCWIFMISPQSDLNIAQ